jgi:sugar/nucleoside kinase (ribokinase family)
MDAGAGGDYRQRRRGRCVLRGLLYGCHESLPLAESIYLAHACARASLLAANAIDGAKTLAELQAFIKENR